MVSAPPSRIRPRTSQEMTGATALRGNQRPRLCQWYSTRLTLMAIVRSGEARSLTTNLLPEPIGIRDREVASRHPERIFGRPVGVGKAFLDEV